jgi:anti-anti-sigma factor
MPNSGSPTSFDVTAEHLNGVVRLQARGELDLSTTPLLERALAAVEGLQPATIVLDFQDLAFIDSTGLHALLRAHQRATESGRLLVVINGTEGVRKVFELTGTEHLLAPSLPAEVHGALLVEGWSPIAIPSA